MRTLAALAAAILLAGCSSAQTAGVTSLTPVATTSSAPTPTPPSFTADELALLGAEDMSTRDPDAAAFIARAHKLCTLMAPLSDEEVFTTLKTSENRVTGGRILMLLCKDPRYMSIVVAVEIEGSVISGTYYVGTDAGQLPPGKYKTIGPAVNCYWSRTSEDGNIIANDYIANAPGGVRLTVKPTDYEVEMQGCGIWVPDNG